LVPSFPAFREGRSSFPEACEDHGVVALATMSAMGGAGRRVAPNPKRNVMTTTTQTRFHRYMRRRIAAALLVFASNGNILAFRSAIGRAHRGGEQEFFAFCLRYLGIPS